MRTTTWRKRALCIFYFSTLSIFPAIAQEMPQPNSAVTITPDKLDFGTAAVSEAGSPQVITITNPGSAPVAINLLVSGIDFSQSTDCGDSLAAGASCTVQVTFKPATTGPRLGTLIVDASRGNLHRVNLSGTGK
jgi:Cep192 domain 4